MIIRPPIVGVPILVTRCELGPSVRIGCPRPWRVRRLLMMVGPNRNTTTSAVTTAPPVRNVM